MSKKNNVVLTPKSTSELERMCIVDLELYINELEVARAQQQNPVPWEVEVMYVKKELDSKLKAKRTQEKLETEYVFKRFENKNFSMVE